MRVCYYTFIINDYGQKSIYNEGGFSGGSDKQIIFAVLLCEILILWFHKKEYSVRKDAFRRENDMDLLREQMKREQEDKLERYRILNRNVRKGETLFTGSSLMEQFPINELLMTNDMRQVIYNRGIGGFTTTDMLQHMEEMVFGTEPSRIFINIGTNDIGNPAYRLEDLLERYARILSIIQERLPEAEIYVMAYYPVNETDKIPDGEWGKTAFVTRTNENITFANDAVEKLVKRMGCRFINVNEGLTDEDGKLKKEFTIEGIHMYANGYQVVLDNLKQYL